MGGGLSSVAWDFELAADASYYLRYIASRLEQTNSDLALAGYQARVEWEGPHRQTFDTRIQQLGTQSAASVDLLRQLANRLDTLSNEVKEEYERRQRCCSQ